MGLPMLASLLLAICLISTLFDPLPAKAETPLDIEFDFKDGIFKNLAQSTGDFEKLKGEYFLVGDFYGRDQCMATPEAQTIHSFGMYFQLPKNGFNGGKGMTICHAGELDKNNMANGLVPSKQYRVQNVENEVAEMCEAARLEYMAKCKGEKKCLDFVNAPWHGFRVSQKKNSHDLEIHLSTSNHVFIIPADKIPDGEFFIKLTKWNTLVATVSTEIGPGHHEYGDRRRKEKVDTGLIPVEKDAKLRQGFFANVGKGALLAKYMGIWSLAADILPHAQDDVLQFFVILSDCSDLKASFMLPSDSEPPKPKNGFGPLPINAKFFLSEEPMTQIRGRVKPKAKEFVIQLIKMQIDENKLNGIRIKVGNFDEMEKELANCKSAKIQNIVLEKESAWINSKAQIEFIWNWNADFILKIKKASDHLNVSLNCKEFKTFKIVSDKLAFNERYLYNISGDVEIFDTTKGKDEQKQIEKEDKFMRSTELHVTTGHGILIRGEMKEWGQIDITFYKDKEVYHYGQPLKISMRHFVFRATRNNNKAIVEMANTNVDAKVEHYKNLITYLPPILKAFEGVSKGNYFTFNGYVPLDANSFEIRLLSIPGIAENYTIGKCTELADKCKIMLHINFDFNSNELILAETPKSWPSPFTRGSYFNFQINFEEKYKIKLIIDDFENSFAISDNVFTATHIEEFVKFSNELELNVTKGGGIFCRGKLYSKWEEIKIAYGKKMDGKTLMAELEFIGHRDKVEIKAKTVNNQIDLKELELSGDELDEWKKWSENGEYFELHVELTQKKEFILTLNDRQIKEVFQLDHEPVIKNIKIDADFLEDDFMAKTTILKPYLLKIKSKERPNQPEHKIYIKLENTTILIDGKIRKHAKSFEANLLHLEPENYDDYEVGKCKAFYVDQCDFVIHFAVDFNNKTMLLQEFAGWERSRFSFNSTFDRGVIFSLQMRYVNYYLFNITQGTFSYSFKTETYGEGGINYMEIIGDFWLFGEPKFIPNDLMDKIQNTTPKDES